MLIEYKPYRPQSKARGGIKKANEIVAEYVWLSARAMSGRHTNKGCEKKRWSVCVPDWRADRHVSRRAA